MSEEEQVPGQAEEIDEPLPACRFNQLGIFVLDGSASMTSNVKQGKMRKADAVNSAVKEVLGRFSPGASKLPHCFWFAAVAFDTTASLLLDFSQTTRDGVDRTGIDDGYYDPQENHGGGTDIGAGLEKAKDVAERWLEQMRNEEGDYDLPTSVMIVVLSDGMSEPDHPRQVADELKSNERIGIACCFLESDDVSDKEITNATQLLQELCSDPTRLYKTTYDKNSIRDFFEKSVTMEPSDYRHM